MQIALASSRHDGAPANERRLPKKVQNKFSWPTSRLVFLISSGCKHERRRVLCKLATSGQPHSSSTADALELAVGRG